jgi:hypothetical protein
MAWISGTPLAPEMSMTGSGVSRTSANRASASVSSSSPIHTRGRGPTRSSLGRRHGAIVW